MKTKLEKALLIICGVLICVCVGFVIFCFAPSIDDSNIYGTYCTENENVDALYIVFQKEVFQNETVQGKGTYMIYRQHEVLEEGTYESGYSNKGVDVLCLSGEIAIPEIAVIYEHKEVFLIYNGQRLVLKKISDVPAYINVRSPPLPQ